MSNKTKLVLVDDHPIVLNGLRNLLRAEVDFELVGEASSGTTGLRLIRETKPDISILDISMPEMNGIVLARRLQTEAPSVRVLLLTLHEDRAYVKQAIDAGVRGYVLKRSAAENLVQAIRAVLVGGLYVDPAIAKHIFESERKSGARTGTSAGVPHLTDRETEVLKLVALGYTNKDIARRLDIGVKSVETFKSRGTEKLGLKTRAELVRFAAMEGWLADM